MSLLELKWFHWPQKPFALHWPHLSLAKQQSRGNLDLRNGSMGRGRVLDPEAGHRGLCPWSQAAAGSLWAIYNHLGKTLVVPTVVGPVVVLYCFHALILNLVTQMQEVTRIKKE